MQRARVVSTVLSVLVVTLVTFSPVPAEANDDFRFQYAAKVVCGFDPPGVVLRVIPGQYATSVNIHAPGVPGGARSANFRKRLSLTFPPAAQEPGPVSGYVNHVLQAGEALQVDCEEIPSEFFPGAVLPPYIEGFLVIESDVSLDVSVVYTAGDPGGQVRSIDIEDVRERRLR